MTLQLSPWACKWLHSANTTGTPDFSSPLQWSRILLARVLPMATLQSHMQLCYSFSRSLYIHLLCIPCGTEEPGWIQTCLFSKQEVLFPLKAAHNKDTHIFQAAGRTLMAHKHQVMASDTILSIRKPYLVYLKAFSGLQGLKPAT